MGKRLLADGLNGTQFLDTTFEHLVGGKVYTYLPGTSTPTPSYTDESLSAAHTNPIILDTYGRPPSNVIWLFDETDIAVYDANNVLLYTISNINPPTVTEATIGGWATKESTVLIKTTAYSVVAADDGKLIINTTAGSWTLTLLAASTAGNGFSFDFLNAGTSGSITVDPSGSETINGVATLEILPGWSYHLRSDGSNWRALTSRPSMQRPSGSVVAPHKNLRISNTASVLTITADSLILADSGGMERLFTSVSKTIDDTVSGAGGLDTGSITIDTWYHIWIIANPQGTINGMISLSATSPTLPSGYTFKGYLGAVYVDFANDQVLFSQRNLVVNRLSGGAEAVSDTPGASFAAADLSAFIPTTAVHIFGYLGVSNSSGGAGSILIASPSNDVNVYGGCQVSNETASTSIFAYAPFRMQLLTDQTLYWRGNPSTTNGKIGIQGWEY